MAEAIKTSSEDCTLSNAATIECAPDARRRKMPPEIGPNLMGSSSTVKKFPKKYPPPPPPVVVQNPWNPPRVEVTEPDEGGNDMKDMKAFANALETICRDKEVPESTPENAPFDLVLDFMTSVIKEDFKGALKFATDILKYEPTNSTVEEYLPVLKELIQLDQEETDSSSTSGSETSVDDGDSSSCSSSSSSLDDDSSEAEEEEGSGASGQSEAELSDCSVSTVASDEYLPDYGEDAGETVHGDDGYETTGTPGNEEEEEEA